MMGIHPVTAKAWILFGVFLTANLILSYSSASLVVKAWIFAMGILVPAFLGFVGFRKMAMDPARHGEGSSLPMAAWFWILLAAGAVFLRYHRLTDFHLWPTGDEGLHGFLALPLVKEWDWRFFYTVGEHPPLLIWSLAFFFGAFESPFFNLWFLPAFFSLLAVPFGYLAVCRILPRSSAALFTLLMAFSFWPLYFGRFCHQGLFIPFWELSSFWLLALFLEARPGRHKTFLGALLGIWSGLGAWSFTAWAVVLAVIGATVLFHCLKAGRRSWLSVGAYGLGALAALFPFLWAVLREGYGGHLIDASAASGWFSASHGLLTHLSYFTSLFWGSLQVGTSYGPSWGGMLNPVLASFFFLGTLRMIREWRVPWIGWALFAAGVCALPGLLAADYVELNRILPILPFLLLGAVVGIHWFSTALSPAIRFPAVGILLLASFALDLAHLYRPVLRDPPRMAADVPLTGDPNLNAYRLLKRAADQEGPGLIFTDFLLLSNNHTLHVAVHPFNAALNPKLDPERAVWAAVIVNLHYRSFLEERFPGSRWERIVPGKPEDGGLVVGILPLRLGNRETMAQWVRAHHHFHRLNLEAESILNNEKAYQEAIGKLPEGYAFVEGDPFLESLFGEWAAQYHYGPRYEANVRVLERAVQKGYPAAHLYYKLGGLHAIGGRPQQSREAFQKTLRCVPNETAAEEVLRSLGPS